jgi:hypothetical protein
MGEMAETLLRSLTGALARTTYIREHLPQLILAAILIGIAYCWWLLLKSMWKRQRVHNKTRRAALVSSPAGAKVVHTEWLPREGAVPAPKLLYFALVLCVIALSVATFGDVPYDFFTLLRVLVSVTSAGCLALFWKAGKVNGTSWVIVVCLVFYSPLLPAHLHRDTWPGINLVTAIAVCVFLLFAIRGDWADKRGALVKSE